MAVAATESKRAELKLRRLTIDDLEAMVRAGIIGRDEHVELIGGQIVEMNPQGTGHIWALSELIGSFAGRPGTRIIAQSTLELAAWAGPEPDLAVMRVDASRRRRPVADDVLLVIEVADSSLAHDRNTKAPLYAKAGIPEYWIVDLNGERIEVYREPSEEGYREMRFHVRGERLSPLFAADLTVEVDAVLGPPEAAD
jgi:Uma2 family endonuclease